MKVIALVALLMVLGIAQRADDDEVASVIANYSHRVFSGYLQTNPLIVNPQRTHYVFFHSQKDPNADPLILWLSGGPGCSSLLTAFQENGPFVFKPTQRNLSLNPYSWNNNANLLYFQSPGAVGFSESLDKNITDQSAALEVLSALHLFFLRFPSFKNNQLYLAGHGYSSIFQTYLAKYILDNNRDPYRFQTYKLKGLLLGNPCTSSDQCYATGSDKKSFYHYDFLNKHSFFLKNDFEQFLGKCALNYTNEPCYTVRQKLDAIFDGTNTSIYNIYDRCYKGSNSNGFGDKNTGCQDESGIIGYFTDEEQRKNWNINEGSPKWTPCSDAVFANYHGSNGSYWLYRTLIEAGLRLWVYSGDVDSVVPTSGTLRWIDELRHELEMPQQRVWREWWVTGPHPGEDQVGGFVWLLRDLTFVSVKGAGYRAALNQPLALAIILDAFLSDKPLPKKTFL